MLSILLVCIYIYLLGERERAHLVVRLESVTFICIYVYIYFYIYGPTVLAPGWPRATRKRKASRLAHAHTWYLLKNRLSTSFVKPDKDPFIYG